MFDRLKQFSTELYAVIFRLDIAETVERLDEVSAEALKVSRRQSEVHVDEKSTWRSDYCHSHLGLLTP
jgi:hypothetical protein